LSPREDIAADPPEPPSHLMGGVGGGDFWQTGHQIVGLAMATVRVGPQDRVLDVGCGLGRVALPLSRLLDDRGQYDGFDTSREYVDWCQTALELDPARYRFHYFSIRSSHYNERGAATAEAFVFPWPANSFSLAIAVSLFTHLSAGATQNYLNQIARTLEPGGRLFASFFVLDDQSVKLVEQGATEPGFSALFDEGMVGNPANPEAAVAFQAEWLASALSSAGLVFDAFYPGRWRHLPAISHQDLVIAHKARM
jgi:SAM-dependent methyltransferase